jgi:hypothetical protein
MALYIEQYDRMKRWYDKFAALNQGRPHDSPSENYVDEIYAFFQNAYHFKDWLKNDGTLASPVVKDVEQFINGDRSLRLCADICNSLKHLVLKKGERSKENPTFGRKQYGLSLGAGPTKIKLEYEINTASGSVDAFQLATDCMAAWDKFRAKHGI